MSMQSVSLLTLTQTLSGTVAAHRFVTWAGAQAGADANTMGVARTAGVSGEKVSIDVMGTAIVESGAAVTAGSQLESDASGRAINWATSGPVIGRALQAAAGAGEFIEVVLIPN